jgi:predicted restriction endonuclease
MATEHDIYNRINEMECVEPEEIYNQLIKEYPKNIVNFVMEDEYGYVYITSNDRETRDDKQFKLDVKKRYNNRCILTGVSATTQVCHIKPLSECNGYEKYDVNNGILLRDDIHTLFDRHDIIIEPDTLIVRVSDEIMNSPQDECYHCYDGVVLEINDMSKQFLRMKYI